MHQDLESQAAAALAEELVKSAGLEMPVFDILQHTNKAPGTPTGSIKQSSSNFLLFFYFFVVLACH